MRREILHNVSSRHRYSVAATAWHPFMSKPLKRLSITRGKHSHRNINVRLHHPFSIRLKGHKTHWQYPPICPSFRTSILYLRCSFLDAKSVKLIIRFRPLQNRRCLEHSREESVCKHKFTISQKLMREKVGTYHKY